MRPHAQLNVAPRYTCGSPALVDPSTARRVAIEELHGFKFSVSGVYGEEKKGRALKDGLALIVYTLTERARGWEVIDILAVERHFWPFQAKCPTCRQRHSCRRGVLTEHTRKDGWRSVPCSGSNQYVGQKLEFTDDVFAATLQWLSLAPEFVSQVSSALESV